MRPSTRLVAAAVALGAVLPVASAADAATAPTAAAGLAQSGATLVAVSAFGKSVSLGTLSSIASTTGAADAAVSFTPVTIDGAKTGTQTVTPATSPKTVAAVSTGAVGAVPATLLSVTSPAADLSASLANGAASGLTGNLGQVSVFGANLLGNGTVAVGSVVNGVDATAGKSVSVTNVGLPSLADLIAGLGIDLSALPLAAVRDVLRSLPGTLEPAIEALMTATESAQAAVDSAQAGLASAQAASAPAQAAVSSAAAGVTQADAAVATATSTLNSALGAAGLSLAAFTALPDALKPAPVVAALTALTQAQSAKAAADAALATANAALASVNAAVDAAQAALNTVLATLRAAIAAVLAAAANLLDVPLASIASVTVRSLAKTGKTAADSVADVQGTISGVNVLGADVLALAGLGSSLDVVGTATAAVSQLNAKVATVLGDVFGALDGAVPGLSVPTPTVAFLSKQTATGRDGAFNTATATVSALTVSLGSLSVPTLVALPTLPALPGITQTANAITTAPLSITVGQLSESSRFRPASLAAPVTPGAPAAPAAPAQPGPSLPATGAPIGLAIAALAVVGMSLGLRRRTAAEQG